MALDADEGRSRFLAAVVRCVCPQTSQSVAEATGESLLDDVDIIPETGLTTSEMIAAFNAANAGEVFRFRVYPSFMSVLALWVPVDATRLDGCGNGQRPRAAPQTTQDCWKPVLTAGQGFSPKRRYDWACKRIQDARARPSPLGAQLVPGETYGGLWFVDYASPSFSDEQIWMTNDFSLYLLNERDCLLEAFRQAVVSAEEGLLLGLAIASAEAVVVGALGVGISGLSAAGQTAVRWTLMNPLQATGLAGVGAQLTLDLVGGTEGPPIGPADELLMLVGAEEQAAKTAVRYIATVTEVEEGLVRAEVTYGRIVMGAEMKELGGLSSALRLSRASPGKLTSTARLLLTSKHLLDESTVAALEQLDAPTRAIAVEGANRFARFDGFGKVLKDLLSTPQKKQGAVPVLQFVLERISPELAAKSAISFEMVSGPTVRTGTQEFVEMERVVDVKIDSIRYEFKNVKEIRASFVTGTKGGFGQLQRDLFRLLGRGEGGIDQIRTRLRWVFVKTKLPEELNTVSAVADELMRLLTKKGLFQGWPASAVERLRAALAEDVVVVWESAAGAR